MCADTAHAKNVGVRIVYPIHGQVLLQPRSMYHSSSVRLFVVHARSPMIRTARFIFVSTPDLVLEL